MRIHATEAETQQAILELLTVRRVFAFRLNTASFKVEKRFFRAHSLGPGAADILALPEVMYGDNPEIQPLWIECKSEKGQQTPEQANFEAHVRKAGHAYILARSVDVVEAWLQGKGV